MAEFDDRWQRLVAAARTQHEPEIEIDAARVRRLARLARRTPAIPVRRPEWKSLVATAALIAGACFVLVPREAGEWIESVRCGLASLPAQVPRPPHPPPAATALELLPDFASLFASSPSENHP